MLTKYLKEYKLLIVIAFILVLIQVWATLYQPNIISHIITALNEVDEFGNTTINQTLVNQNGILLVVVGLIGLVNITKNPQTKNV